MNYNYLFLLLFYQISFSQGNLKTIEVKGGNWIEILRYSKYYIDSTNTMNVTTVSEKLNHFKNNNSSLLSLKKQPYNLWVHLQFKNKGQKQKYWLGMYSQADTILVYERNLGNEKFWFKKISDYSKTAKKRDSINVRFHYAPFVVNNNQYTEVLLLVKNRKHFTNIYMDFTTPHDNLNWEKGFYWIIGSFVSIFVFTALLCFLFGLLLHKMLFINYGFYLIITAIFILHEELFISVFETPCIYNLVYHSNSNFLMTIAVGLNMQIFLMLTNIKKTASKLYFYLNIFSKYVVFFGVFSSVINYIFPQLNFLNTYYNILWNKAVILNVLCVIINAGIIQFYFFKRKKYLNGFLLGVLLLILNPVIYYLNYSKIIELYEIQHPNYYYYIILLEILLLGLFIILQYRNKIRESIKFLKEKIKAEEDLKIEKETKEGSIKNAVFESQSTLLSNLSKDLHDDLGQKLSVINFSLENIKLTNSSVEVDELKRLSVEVSNSIRDLSHWMSNFKFEQNTLSEIIQQDITRINKVLPVEVLLEDADTSKLTVSEKIILFRIYQELINNCLKHSEATVIKIKLSNTNFEFSNNGTFNENRNINGIGLKNIYGRIATIKWIYEKQPAFADDSLIILRKHDKNSFNR
jgi:signal transduction histidine kinase